MTKNKQKKVKAWAVIDTSLRYFRKDGYIDVSQYDDGTLMAIYLSKNSGLRYHKKFTGKKVIPCLISYSLPPKKSLPNKKQKR